MLGKIKTQTSIGGGGGLSQQLRNWLMQIGQRFWWYIALTESSTHPLNRQLPHTRGRLWIETKLDHTFGPRKITPSEEAIYFFFTIKFLFSVRQPVIGAAETKREAPP